MIWFRTTTPFEKPIKILSVSKRFPELELKEIKINVHNRTQLVGLASMLLIIKGLMSFITKTSKTKQSITYF